MTLGGNSHVVPTPGGAVLGRKLPAGGAFSYLNRI